ncbi:dTDP-glucose 4,6-dehydratase [Treponema peruense]|uniref:dTDP-glucose 4,6-dehydratase n=1 Tax=Treponema peruense TaxID=2787628 RepID=A0A7T3V3V3_9SPIR|nr:dTDP-glucose 4,6-dehydratase [Treponema peruense]QPZ99951.1 dTDP-glucose 4,6-dehydratase [Treponema peruense]
MSDRKLKNILVTGGCGFIGSNFINYMFGQSATGSREFMDSGFDGRIVNVDCLTYAGNPDNLSGVQKAFGGTRYFFEKADICDRSAIERIFKQYDIDTVIHFAAESHVDRSILGPEAFIKTNIMGTYTLLDVARKFWNVSLDNQRDDVLFHHISTDEVYGSLGETGYFTETTPYDPRSPYSASKASSDHIVMAYYHTYGLPITLSNCTNNYGPYQFPEKLIPLMILNMQEGKNLPVYGEGKNIRDWIYVEDHNRAVWQIVKDGITGQKYNIGGENEWQNIKLLDKLIELTAKEAGLNADDVRKTIVHVKDRPGHDARYAIDCAKIKKELGWERKMTFEEGLTLTVKWYLSHKEWIERVQSGEYLKWIDSNYAGRK